MNVRPPACFVWWTSGESDQRLILGNIGRFAREGVIEDFPSTRFNGGLIAPVAPKE